MADAHADRAWTRRLGDRARGRRATSRGSSLAITSCCAGRRPAACVRPARRGVRSFAIVWTRPRIRNRLPSGALRLHARGHDLNHFLGTACFADYAVVAEEAAVVVDRDVPFDALAMLGCSVVTGVGAVMTAARVPAGARVAVIGAGGVGLNVIQGAVLSDAAQIIAVDRHAAPLALAQAFGATDVVEAPPNTVDAVRALTGRTRRRFRVRHRRHARDAARRARGRHERRHGCPDWPLTGRRARERSDVSVCDAGKTPDWIRVRIWPADGRHRPSDSLVSGGTLETARAGESHVYPESDRRRAGCAGDERGRTRRHNFSKIVPCDSDSAPPCSSPP